MSSIKKDGAIHNFETSEYYGELINFDHIDCSGESRVMYCRTKSPESTNRIKDIISPNNLETVDDVTFIMDERKYDIENFKRLISLFDGEIGVYTMKEFLSIDS